MHLLKCLIVFLKEMVCQKNTFVILCYELSIYTVRNIRYLFSWSIYYCIMRIVSLVQWFYTYILLYMITLLSATSTHFILELRLYCLHGPTLHKVFLFLHLIFLRLHLPWPLKLPEDINNHGIVYEGLRGSCLPRGMLFTTWFSSELKNDTKCIYVCKVLAINPAWQL